jgi:pyrroloquinoline quinone biosynthesis protein B
MVETPPAPLDASPAEAKVSPPEPKPEPELEPASGPRLRVLGIAQDGGLPHVACDCERCDAAREDPERASPVASVAAIDSGVVWIVDATPDLPRQLDMLADVRELDVGKVDRAPVSGILLTHAHMGHYLGLATLGFEAASTDRVPLRASGQMVRFLDENAPWNQLLRLNNVIPQVVEPNQVVVLGGGVKAKPIAVPHRAEYTDTLGWYIYGPNRRALYIPDTDPWAKWDADPKFDVDAALDGVDLLLIDGTFYSADELPGRDVAEIGHPLMTDTMDRFEARVSEGLELWFVHLNHSNPTLDPDAPQRRELEARGFAIARVGAEYAL